MTGPGPIVDPYILTQRAKPFMARVSSGRERRSAGRQHGKWPTAEHAERHTSQALESMGTDARHVRCNGHMLDQAISHPVCSAHHSPPWKTVAWWRNGRIPSGQRHMGVTSWPLLNAQRVWLSPGALLACGSVTIATTLLLSRCLLGMRHAVVSCMQLWEALARLPCSSLTRGCCICPARDSKVGSCCPRPPSGRTRDARSEPPRRVLREVLMKLSSDVRRCREELPRAGDRTATAAVADHGRPEASRAYSGMALDWYDPWGQQGLLWGGVPAYGMRSTAKNK
jgi:hypothetical protein